MRKLARPKSANAQEGLNNLEGGEVEQSIAKAIIGVLSR